MTLATAQKTITASPAAIYKIWADVEQWSDWDKSVQWSLLDSSFAVGSKIKMKPRGGPQTTAILTLVEQDRAFNDISRLPGATIYFNHHVEQTNAETVVTHTITMDGPLSWLWVRIMGKGLRDSLQPAVDKLVMLAENNERVTE